MLWIIWIFGRVAYLKNIIVKLNCRIYGLWLYFKISLNIMISIIFIWLLPWFCWHRLAYVGLFLNGSISKSTVLSCSPLKFFSGIYQFDSICSTNPISSETTWHGDTHGYLVCRLIFWTLPAVELNPPGTVHTGSHTVHTLQVTHHLDLPGKRNTERDEQRATQKNRGLSQGRRPGVDMSARKGTLRMCMYIDIYVYNILQMYMMNDYNSAI